MSENCLCRAECSTLWEARSDFGGVAGYVPKIGTRNTAKWNIQNGAMSFQTRPGIKIPDNPGYFSSHDPHISRFSLPRF
ncbi:DUF6783 domain-containing protein [Lachnospiraceae bacterium 54-53]